MAMSNAQIDATLPDRSEGHYECTHPFEDQTDTAGIEHLMDPMPQNFKRTSILQEKMAGGYTPNTAPVGEAQPAPTPTPSGRNLTDTEALRRLLGQ
jgi:hypothetical protein